MTPVREFLYFLVIVLVFGLLAYWWGEQNDQTVTAPVIQQQNDVEVSDTALISPDDQSDVPEKANADGQEPETSLINPTPLSFAAEDPFGFDFLFEKLKNIKQERLPVRIIYFGDSQIENDRITDALRTKFQERYGGKGPGFVPLDQFYNLTHQLMIEISKNWVIKTFQDKDFNNKSLLFKNTLLTKSAGQGWFRIKRIKSLNPKPDFQLMKLYYSAKDSCRVRVKVGRETIYTGYLSPDNEISTLDFQFSRTPDDIRFDFTAHDTLIITGLSFETKTGVLVDNVALRGLSYPIFESSDQERVKQMIDQVNVGLFVLHFGVNLVPYLSDDFQFFKRQYQKQIAFMKRVRPEVPILIIGVSDMAEKQDGQFRSYRNIPAIKAIQYEIAMENQAVFWDLQAFMGGEGGMVNWVKANPSLSRKDYTHFSKQGATIIGNELAKMILNELKTDSLHVP